MSTETTSHHTMTVTLDARSYEDEDDSLTAAADDVQDALDLYGWDLSPRWGRDRATILLTIPEPACDDTEGWDSLRNLRCLSAVREA